MTAAAIASPRSKPLMRLTVETGAAGREGAAVAAGAALFGGAEATRAAGGAAEGLGGAGRTEDGGAACGAAVAGGAEPGEAGAAGPPAGKVGNLMVAVGLGGKLMRTVCFLGSAGLGGLLGGGVAPGGLGLSAIAVPSETKVAYQHCQELASVAHILDTVNEPAILLLCRDRPDWLTSVNANLTFPRRGNSASANPSGSFGDSDLAARFRLFRNSPFYNCPETAPMALVFNHLHSDTLSGFCPVCPDGEKVASGFHGLQPSRLQPSKD